MKLEDFRNLNEFCSGHMIVNKDRKIVFCNDYICNLSGLSNDKLVNLSISKFFTKASIIFIDSYIYPLLHSESVVQESQINWIDKEGKAIPVVVNIKLDKQGRSFWSLYECSNRDKLQSELIKAKEKLEEQSEKLFHLATTDPLTGLLNSRELAAQANKVVQQATRSSSTYAILSIDVDFFKRVNDTHGHQIGDKVLKHLASLLVEQRRTNDLVARVGGEEFVLLLPDINQGNAFKFAEKIRKKVEHHSIDNLDITVSIGLVVSQKDRPKDFEELLNLSDKALYESKNSGRNKTTIAQYK